MTRCAHGLDGFGQGRLDVLGAKAVDQHELARNVLRVERGDEPLQPRRVHRGADLDAHRVGDATAILDMCAVDLRRAHADPRHVRREVVPAFLTRNEARLGLLVVQDERLVTGIEIGSQRLVHFLGADGLEELEAIGHRGHDPFVLKFEWRMTDKTEIPILRVMQVGKTAIDQGAHEIQRQGRPFIAAQQQQRIRFSRSRRELGMVDDIAAIRGQRDPVACLGIGGSRLGILPGHATDANDGLFESVR